MSTNPTLSEALAVLCVTRMPGDAEAEKTINAAIHSIISGGNEIEALREGAASARESLQDVISHLERTALCDIGWSLERLKDACAALAAPKPSGHGL